MIKLLVIDDHPVAISGIKSILNGYAEIVYFAHNLKDSLNFDSNNFDLIILDLLLDENNPVDNVEKLKNTYPNIPIIIFTCEDSVIWKRKMLEAGVSAYIIKSSDKSNIKSVLDNVIKNKNKIEYENNLNNRLLESQKVAKIGNWEVNLTTGELYWSDIIFEIFGKDPKSFKPNINTFRESVHPDDQELVYDSEKKSEKTGYHDVIHRIILPSKEIRYVHEFARRHINKNDESILRGTVQDITDIKETEYKLMISEKKYRRLFESAKDGILILNADTGKIEDVNPFLIELLGYSKEEFIEKSIWEIGIFKDITSNRDNFLELQQKEYIRYEDLPLETFDGQKINVEFVSNVYLVNNHKVIQCNIRDITERVILNKALRDSEEKYSKCFLTSPYAIMITRPKDGKIIEINDTFLKITGYDRKEVMGETSIDLNLWGDIENRNWVVSSVIKGDDILDTEFQFRGKNNKLIIGLFSAHIIRFNNENFILSIIKDITEEKAIEKLQTLSNIILKLLNTNINLKDIINNVIKLIQDTTKISAVGIRLKCDEDYPFFSQNGFTDEFIFTENSLIRKDKNNKICRDENGDPILECTCGLVISGKQEPLNLFTKSGSIWTNNSSTMLELSPELDMRIHPRNNCIHAGFGSVAIIPIRMNEKIVGVLQLNENKIGAFTENTISIFEGIGEIIGGSLIRKQIESDLLKAKEKAEESEKMKMAFLSNMSHDLRTPINSIIGFSELLKENNLNKTEKLKYLDVIIQNGDILTNLINDIIDITKIDSGSLKVQKIEIDLNKLLQELRIQYSKLKSNKVKINIDIDLNSNIYILSDKYRLKQILMNLLSNSIKFTKKGYIKFGYTILKNNKLKIYVKDTGIGISKDNLNIIFNRFSQFGQPGSKLKGAGLGLPISKSLVELLDFSELKVESELDKGSTFYFEVPYIIKDEVYIDEKDNDTNDLNLNLKNKNVLIVEDDTNFQLILKSFLKQTNCEIFIDDGIYALDIVKNNKIDFILLDLGLGEIDGYNILHEIKTYNKDIVVIVQSAFALPEFRKKAFDLGCDDFLSKPVTKHQIFNTILKHI